MSEHIAALPIIPTATPVQNESYGLKHGILSPLEVLGQSVANIAPTATPTVVIPLVFAVAGAVRAFGPIGPIPCRVLRTPGRGRSHVPAPPDRCRPSRPGKVRDGPPHDLQ